MTEGATETAAPVVDAGAGAGSGRKLRPHETRRTFAIISHPDAGKTTLTEKLLLMSGAVRAAGEVKARGNRRRARSDWMEIEQSRGISVTSSAMTFEHRGLTFNLLDTPGHSDFSEDTYRTLTAVDSAIMVIDAAKGIESQTLKLFEVCRLRDIPIITFINKIDREGLDPLELLDEIAEKLALDVSPVTWPIGMGGTLKGYLDPRRDRLVAPDGTETAANWEAPEEGGPFADDIGRASLEGYEIASMSLPAFDLQSYREGHLSPVFFGSALKEIGVEDLLNAIGDWAPPPRMQPAEPAPVAPDADEVTGFVFKVQANMDPKHRDRIAFMRVSSGTFRRGMKLRNTRSGRDLTVSNPILFFAQDRELAEEAIAGDIVGIPNHGTLAVGDTLTEGSALRVTGIPSFAPEILRRVRLSDPLKAKALAKALHQLSEEGVTQVFRPMIGSDWVVGVVGPLQIEILGARLAAEYNVPVGFETTSYETARWVRGDAAEVKRLGDAKRASLALDGAGDMVFMARNPWDLQRIQDDWPKLTFAATRERA